MPLYEVEICKTLYVLADNEYDANREANKSARYTESDYFSAVEVTDIDEVRNGWKDAIPFGAPCDGTIRDLLE